MMDELRLIWFPVWMVAAWAAFALRPGWLRTSPEADSLLVRLGRSLLSVTFCFAVASIVVVVLVVAVGFATGVARGVS